MPRLRNPRARLRPEMILSSAVLSFSRLGPPLVVWAAAATSVALVAVASGYPPFDSATWSRWDSWNYEQIASHGYYVAPCPPPRSDRWCGDAHWFPGYPWLLRSLHQLGLPLRGTAVVASWLFTGATLVLLWNTFLARRRGVLVVGALLYAAWAPGQVYHYAIFPLSMLAFFMTAHIWFLYRGRYLAAGLAGAAAALSYPLGVLVIPVSAVWLLTERADPLRERLRRVVVASGLPLCAVFVFVADQRLETGHWDAYRLMQQPLNNPVAVEWHSLRPLLHGSPFSGTKGPAIQTALVTLVLGAVVLDLAFRRGRSFDRLDALILPLALAIWLVALAAQGESSLARGQAALLPLAVLVARFPQPLVVLFVVPAFLVSIAVERLFLNGLIV